MITISESLVGKQKVCFWIKIQSNACHPFALHGLNSSRKLILNSRLNFLLSTQIFQARNVHSYNPCSPHYVFSVLNCSEEILRWHSLIYFLNVIDHLMPRLMHFAGQFDLNKINACEAMRTITWRHSFRWASQIAVATVPQIVIPCIALQNTMSTVLNLRRIFLYYI